MEVKRKRTGMFIKLIGKRLSLFSGKFLRNNAKRAQLIPRQKRFCFFYADGNVYRAVSESYKEQYDFFLSSGLCDLLVEKNYLIPHNEVSPDQWPEEFSRGEVQQVYKILRPEKIPYISYPYEWCFQQLKDAALLTLNIQLKALEYNMTLKDASAFNIDNLGSRL